jgi:hypothetical protein
MDKPPRQLELILTTAPGGPAEGERREAPRAPAAPRQLRLLKGEGRGRDATLRSRDDLARVLVGAAGDMLLKRISAPRAHEIQAQVERLLALFDRVDREPLLEPVLRRELDGLEALLRESKPKRR